MGEYQNRQVELYFVKNRKGTLMTCQAKLQQGLATPDYDACRDQLAPFHYRQNKVSDYAANPVNRF